MSVLLRSGAMLPVSCVQSRHYTGAFKVVVVVVCDDDDIDDGAFTKTAIVAVVAAQM